MRVRQLIGGHAGEIVDMPYHIAMRAFASGAAETLDVVQAPRAPSSMAHVAVVVDTQSADQRKAVKGVRRSPSWR